MELRVHAIYQIVVEDQCEHRNAHELAGEDETFVACCNSNIADVKSHDSVCDMII